MLKTLKSVFRSPAGSSHVLGINARNRALIRVYNQRRFYPLANDKLRTKEALERVGIPVPKTLHIFKNMYEARRVFDLLGNLNDFVIKPAQGSGGNGILVLTQKVETGWLDNDGDLWTSGTLRQHISNIVFGNYAHTLTDRALIEERLIPAPLLEDVPAMGLPDIRIITLNGKPLMGMLRIPTKHSHGKANLHQGAVGVGVDLDTGRTVHASFHSSPISAHPDSGAFLLGLTIKAWPEIKACALRASEALPLGYLGIDLVLDARHGPLVLEANVRPGLQIQNANNRGLREAIVFLRKMEEAK